VTAIFLIAAYASLATEISNYWNQLYSDSYQELTLNGNTTTYWNNDYSFLNPFGSLIIHLLF
jgi:hypothetical protein